MSANYVLHPGGRGVVGPDGTYYPLRGRTLEVYRLLSERRGRPVSTGDLLSIIWQNCATVENVRMTVRFLRRQIALDVVESHGWRHGYIVR